MADEHDNKTEKATPKRKEDARQKGQVARSQIEKAAETNAVLLEFLRALA